MLIGLFHEKDHFRGFESGLPSVVLVTKGLRNVDINLLLRLPRPAVGNVGHQGAAECRHEPFASFTKACRR